MSKKPSAKSRWQLFAHPAFSETFDALVGEVNRLRAADAEKYKDHPKTKLLKRILDLIEIEIPRGLGANEYGWDPRTGTGGGQSFSGDSGCSSATAPKPMLPSMHG